MHPGLGRETLSFGIGPYAIGVVGPASRWRRVASFTRTVPLLPGSATQTLLQALPSLVEISASSFLPDAGAWGGPGSGAEAGRLAEVMEVADQCRLLGIPTIFRTDVAMHEVPLAGEIRRACDLSVVETSEYAPDRTDTVVPEGAALPLFGSWDRTHGDGPIFHFTDAKPLAGTEQVRLGVSNDPATFARVLSKARGVVLEQSPRSRTVEAVASGVPALHLGPWMGLAGAGHRIKGSSISQTVDGLHKQINPAEALRLIDRNHSITREMSDLLALIGRSRPRRVTVAVSNHDLAPETIESFLSRQTLQAERVVLLSAVDPSEHLELDPSEVVIVARPDPTDQGDPRLVELVALGVQIREQVSLDGSDQILFSGRPASGELTELTWSRLGGPMLIHRGIRA
ncbi:hypothetical protein BH23ACT5_BH23ACT5_01810 [soil metagenome]